MSQSNRFAAMAESNNRSPRKSSNKKRSGEDLQERLISEGKYPIQHWHLAEESKRQPEFREEDRADALLKVTLGQDKFNEYKGVSAQSEEIKAEQDDDSEEYYSESDEDVDEDSKEVIKLINVHKTYLLGIEGVPALRGVNLTVHEG